MKKLIVATDFSPAAYSALQYAIELARNIEAGILLFHVYQIPVSMADVPVVLVSADELKKNAEERLVQTKDSILNAAAGVPVETLSKLGDTVDELYDICQEIKPFAVVMGTRGESGLERTLFGSSTLTAIKHLNYPVLSVPVGKLYGAGIRKIGFACDFKKVLESTPAGEITAFVKTIGAELHVLNVDFREKHFTAETPEQSLLLESMLKDLHPQYHFIEHKDIEEGINAFVRQHQIDLLLTIPKKHKFLEALFHKSSTRQFVLEAEVPVVCIHE